MKYLAEYMEARQTELFKNTGTFFAFSNSQFMESRKEGKKYVSLGAGMICEKEHVKTLVDGLDLIYKESIEQDIKENGMEAIIIRELYNHEAFYTWEIEDTVDKLKDYPTTEEEIAIVFRQEAAKQD